MDVEFENAKMTTEHSRVKKIQSEKGEQVRDPKKRCAEEAKKKTHTEDGERCCILKGDIPG